MQQQPNPQHGSYDEYESYCKKTRGEEGKEGMTMAWVSIRKATDEDRAALQRAAETFIAEHPEVVEGFGQPDPVSIVEVALGWHWHYGTHHEECQAWPVMVSEALGENAEAIAYGDVGYFTE